MFFHYCVILLVPLFFMTHMIRISIGCFLKKEDYSHNPLFIMKTIFLVDKNN